MKHTPDVILKKVENAKDLETIISFHSLYLTARKNGVLEGHYHDLGEKLIELPKLMSEPETVLLMDNGRLNIITEIEVKGKKGIISIELNTVKDINNKFRAYNLVISVFSAKNNYIRNNIKKHVVDIKYAKDDLSQVNPQLYEWLAIINDKSSYDDRLPQNSYKSNPSQQNNSDSNEEFSDPNGRYSKDDTIFDDFEDEEVMFTADGDIAFDGFGADAQRTIDVKEMVQEQGAEHAVYTLYNAALEMVFEVAAVSVFIKRRVITLKAWGMS